MTLFFPILGALILVLTIVDIVWSTLSAAGGGPLARRLGQGLWVLLGRATYADPLILLGTAVLWVGMLWAGWVLVFMGAPAAAVSASTGAPGDFWDRVYFSGFTVTTLGVGDYVPDSPLWQVLTVLAAASGLVFITLAITYYMSVLGAVVEKQQLAVLIRSLGDSPAAMVAGAWDGDGFSGIDSVLASLASMLTLYARRHYAYPVIHYFRPSEPGEALAVQAARLGDALTQLRQGVNEGHRPPPVSLRLARESLRAVLDAIHPDFVSAASEEPPLPQLGPLHEAGIPLRDPKSAFEEEAVQEERRILLGYVRSSRFRWSDVDPVSP